MKIDHNEVLNRWAAGQDLTTIAAAVGTLYDASVSAIISNARLDGDPRAKRRGVSGLRAKHTAILTSIKRRKALAQKPVSIDQIRSAVAAYEGPITQLPPGTHAGHRPRCLEDIGL